MRSAGDGGMTAHDLTSRISTGHLTCRRWALLLESKDATLWSNLTIVEALCKTLMKQRSGTCRMTDQVSLSIVVYRAMFQAARNGVPLLAGLPRSSPHHHAFCIRSTICKTRQVTRVYGLQASRSRLQSLACLDTKMNIDRLTR